MQFSSFNIDLFLRDYWQKKPLLIKDPWSAWNNPLSPDELAGLACDDHVESRLITQESGDWNAENGPLPEDRFGQLDRLPYTLLVQAVDHYIPEVAAVIEPFRFIPNWRIDDVMVSYASDGGGVGPHFDHYDVFLIQGLGTRRWQIGEMCDENTPLLPHDQLRLLETFEPQQQWVLEPGDMLYVPPGISHNGVAVGDDCMTYSVGFRAPSRGELIGDWCDDMLAELLDDDRYADPDLAKQQNPGEISSDAIDRLHALVIEKVGDKDAFSRWFGKYNSTPKYPELDWQPEIPIDSDELRKQLADETPLYRNSASRFSYVRQHQEAVTLFVNGQAFECSGDAVPVAEMLCGEEQFSLDPDFAISDQVADLLVSLCNLGSLAFESEDQNQA